MFRNFLGASRYLLLLPVIGSLLLMLGVVIVGTGVVVGELWSILREGNFNPKASKQLTIIVIESIDMFLVGAICYIVAVGIYKLFITQEDEQLLKRVRIDKLADLEVKIIGVVIVALAVAFLGRATEATDAMRVLQGGVGVAAVIIALCVFLKVSVDAEK